MDTHVRYRIGLSLNILISYSVKYGALWSTINLIRFLLTTMCSHIKCCNKYSTILLSNCYFPEHGTNYVELPCDPNKERKGRRQWVRIHYFMDYKSL